MRKYQDMNERFSGLLSVMHKVLQGWWLYMKWSEISTECGLMSITKIVVYGS